MLIFTVCLYDICDIIYGYIVVSRFDLCELFSILCLLCSGLILDVHIVSYCWTSRDDKVMYPPLLFHSYRILSVVKYKNVFPMVNFTSTRRVDRPVSCIRSLCWLDRL